MKTVIMDIMKRSFTELSKESQIILGIIITITVSYTHLTLPTSIVV